MSRVLLRFVCRVLFSMVILISPTAPAEGAGAPPEAIVLTHGHFDHAGSALQLAEYWDVPIYAHRLEMPYLTGKADYPPPDPTIATSTS